MTAEEVAARYKISRADQDAFAAASQQRAERALNDGSFGVGRFYLGYTNIGILQLVVTIVT